MFTADINVEVYVFNKTTILVIWSRSSESE